MRPEQIKINMAAVNKKVKFVIPHQVNVMSLLLLQILGAIGNYQCSRIQE